MPSAPGTNRPQAERVEPWDWRPAVTSLVGFGSPENASETFDETRAFSIEEIWTRGGYHGSLFANSERASRDFLDQLIGNELFQLPPTTLRDLPIDKAEFQRNLARYNGCPLESLRNRLQWDKGTFEFVIKNLKDRGLIYTIPFEPMDGRSNLYYICDTGVLHQLFNPKWSIGGKARKYFARSWEGLVIRTLMFGPGREANASVWRQDNDEIDLVLRWPSGDPCWAIEIGMGHDKRPSPGFWVGIERLAATERCVIHRGPSDWHGDCERLTLERFLETHALTMHAHSFDDQPPLIGRSAALIDPQE